jgi:hypothetical protein
MAAADRSNAKPVAISFGDIPNSRILSTIVMSVLPEKIPSSMMATGLPRASLLISPICTASAGFPGLGPMPSISPLGE